MKKVLFAVLFCLVGCGGGPDFPGTYLGALVTSLTCSNGARATTSNAVQIVVTESGSDLIINDGSSCADYTATASGSSATMNPKICPPQPGSNVGDTSTLTGGSISLSGNTLVVTLDEQIANSAGSCTGTATGNLTK